jgi:hypothetical protein
MTARNEEVLAAAREVSAWFKEHGTRPPFPMCQRLHRAVRGLDGEEAEAEHVLVAGPRVLEKQDTPALGAGGPSGFAEPRLVSPSTQRMDVLRLAAELKLEEHVDYASALATADLRDAYHDAQAQLAEAKERAKFWTFRVAAIHGTATNRSVIL